MSGISMFSQGAFTAGTHVAGVGNFGVPAAMHIASMPTAHFINAPACVPGPVPPIGTILAGRAKDTLQRAAAIFRPQALAAGGVMLSAGEAFARGVAEAPSADQTGASTGDSTGVVVGAAVAFSLLTITALVTRAARRRRRQAPSAATTAKAIMSESSRARIDRFGSDISLEIARPFRREEAARIASELGSREALVIRGADNVGKSIFAGQIIEALRDENILLMNRTRYIAGLDMLRNAIAEMMLQLKYPEVRGLSLQEITEFFEGDDYYEEVVEVSGQISESPKPLLTFFDEWLEEQGMKAVMLLPEVGGDLLRRDGAKLGDLKSLRNIRLIAELHAADRNDELLAEVFGDMPHREHYLGAVSYEEARQALVEGFESEGLGEPSDELAMAMYDSTGGHPVLIRDYLVGHSPHELNFQGRPYMEMLQLKLIYEHFALFRRLASEEKIYASELSGDPKVQILLGINAVRITDDGYLELNGANLLQNVRYMLNHPEELPQEILEKHFSEDAA